MNRKLFVRGISWSTTNESLAAAFNEFGDVEEATVVMDKSTGKSKVRITLACCTKARELSRF